jgi:hypothetical protein
MFSILLYFDVAISLIFSNTIVDSSLLPVRTPSFRHTTTSIPNPAESDLPRRIGNALCKEKVCIDCQREYLRQLKKLQSSDIYKWRLTSRFCISIVILQSIIILSSWLWDVERTGSWFRHVSLLAFCFEMAH